MTDRRWSRRWLLGRLGIGAALAPFWPPLAGDAAGQTKPKRFIVLFHGNGYGVASQWFPQNATERAFELGPALAPLAPHKGDLIVFEGIDNPAGADGVNYVHIPHMGSILTGVPIKTGSVHLGFGWGKGISLDQYLAAKLGAATALPSLDLLVVGARDRNITQARMSYRGPDQPVAGEPDPRAALTRVLGPAAAPADPPRSTRRSVLDFVKGDLARVRQRVGSEDRSRIDGHVAAIAELETRLARPVTPPASCNRDVSFGQLEPLAGAATYAQRSKGHLDVLVRALACDATRVASLQWYGCGGEGLPTSMSFLGIGVEEHELSHSPGPQLMRVKAWYMQQLAYLVGELKKIPDAGGGTLFDSTMILVCSEHGNGATHDNRNIPFLLMGGAGVIPTGRYLKYGGQPHNRLLTSITQAFGVPVDAFGTPKYGAGRLPGLV